MAVTAVIQVLASLLVVLTLVSAGEGTSTGDEKFSTVISAIADRRVEISKHRFFKMLADHSLPPQKRMSFIPYWTYFAMTFADLLDSWLYIENPQNELEERVNTFIGEDNFHYNLFLNDVEKVLGYTVDRFGSYTAVVRHLWGAESRSVRRLMYTWALCAKKYNDPLITLATFESIEAGLKDIFEVTFAHVYLPEEDGLKGLQYFGLTHVELEVNHTQTAWFREGDTPVRPLGELEVSPLQMEQVMDVVDQLFDGFESMYDEMYNLAMAEDSIKPEKYVIEGWPPIHGFPARHPNQKTPPKGAKTEL